MGHACLALWAPDQETNTPQWALEEIHIDSPVPPVHEQNDDHFDIVDDDFFFGGKEFKEELRKQFYSEVRLYVPESAVEAYREAPVWKNFTHINDKEYNGIDDIMPEDAIRIEDGIVYSDTTIEAYTTAGMRVASASESSGPNALGTGNIYRALRKPPHRKGIDTLNTIFLTALFPLPSLSSSSPSYHPLKPFHFNKNIC